MKLDKFNKRETRFAPWTALCLLSLLAAMVFAVPSAAFAQNYIAELSQECDSALIGTEHTITAKVTEDGAPGATVPMYFMSTDPYHDGLYVKYVLPMTSSSFDENGMATFTYTVDSVDQVDISLLWVKQDGSFQSVTLNTVTTTWTDNEADLCSDSLDVTVGGWDKLKDKKWGGVSIAICGAGCTDSFNVYDVDLDSVQMAGVSPWRSRFRDSRLCEGGKDAYVDLVLTFKRREVLHALEEALGRELVDGEEVRLAVTGTLKEEVTLAVDGTLNEGTVIEGAWEPMIKKIKKRHKWRRYWYQER